MYTLFILLIAGTGLFALMMLGSLLVAGCMGLNHGMVWNVICQRARHAWWNVLDRLQDLYHPRYTIRIYIEGCRETSDNKVAYFLLTPVRIYRVRGPINDVVSELYADAFVAYYAKTVRVRLEVE